MGFAVAGVAATASSFSVGGALLATAKFLAPVVIGTIAARILAPKPSAPGASRSPEGRTIAGYASQDWAELVYGTRRKGGSIPYWVVTGDDREYLHYVVVFAELADPAEQPYEVIALHLDDRSLAVPGDLVADPGLCNLATFIDGDSNKLLYVATYGGDQTTVDSDLNAKDSAWPSTSVFTGACYAVFRMQIDETVAGTPASAEAKVWSAGQPQSFGATIKGRRIYDPRLDTTAGGSGSHRNDDPSTWAYSENPILCARDYLLNYRGVPNSAIDDDVVMAQADICDQSVTVWDGVGGATTQNRYTCNLVLSEGDEHRQNLEKIRATCAGSFFRQSGIWYLYAGAWVASSRTITEEDIVGALDFEFDGDGDDRYNRVEATYRSGTYGTPTDALARENTTWQTDDGETLPKQITLDGVDSEYQAQRLALIDLKLSRHIGKTFRAECNLGCFEIGMNDVVTLDVDELGINDTYRVTRIALKYPGMVEITGRSETSDVWDYDAPTGGTDLEERPAVTQLGRDIPPPTPPSNLTATGTFAGVRLNWDNPAQPFKYVEIWRTLGSNNRTGATLRARTTDNEYLDEDVSPGTDYYYWLVAYNTQGLESDWHPTDPNGGVSARAQGQYVVEDNNFYEQDDAPDPLVLQITVEAGQNVVITGAGTLTALSTGWSLAAFGIHRFTTGDVFDAEVNIQEIRNDQLWEYGEVLSFAFTAEDTPGAGTWKYKLIHTMKLAHANDNWELSNRTLFANIGAAD